MRILDIRAVNRNASTKWCALLSCALLLSACSSPDDGGADEQAQVSETAQLYPIKEVGKWGYMNRDGHLAIAPKFDAAWPFSEGRAMVQSNGLLGYIDATGDFVVEPMYEDAWYFSNGLAPVRDDTQWSFIDRDGRTVVSGVFEIRPDDSEGSGVVTVELDRVRVDGRYGFKNANGQVVIDPKYDQAWYFVDGLARVQIDGLWGYIDRNGDMKIEPEFDVAWDFEDGIARVKVGDAFGYINSAGEYVWAPTS